MRAAELSFIISRVVWPGQIRLCSLGWPRQLCDSDSCQSFKQGPAGRERQRLLARDNMRDGNLELEEWAVIDVFQRDHGLAKPFERRRHILVWALRASRPSLRLVLTLKLLLAKVFLGRTCGAWVILHKHNQSGVEWILTIDSGWGNECSGQRLNEGDASMIANTPRSICGLKSPS